MSLPARRAGWLTQRLRAERSCNGPETHAAAHRRSASQRRTVVGEADGERKDADTAQGDVAARAEALHPRRLAQQREQRALALVADHVAEEARGVLRPERVQRWDEPAQVQAVARLDGHYLDKLPQTLLGVGLALVRLARGQVCSGGW